MDERNKDEKQEEKKKKYNSGDKVGVIEIYLKEKLLHEEDIYISKEKKKKRNKIKAWFND